MRGMRVTAIVLLTLIATPATAGTFTSSTYDGRTYKLYVPGGYQSKAIPLVVMLHGCTQDPDDFATGTQMNTIAEANTFFALYPQQSQSDNAEECWNWYQPADQARGVGEPSELVGIVTHVESSYAVDASRVYAAGISAGAAMAVILGATYPDIFSAIVSGEGLEYGAATSVQGAITAQMSGGPDPATQGQAAYAAMGSVAKLVRVLIVQGTSDSTVAPVNGTQLVTQWAKTDDLASDGKADGNITDTPAETIQGQVPNGHSYTITTYNDATTGKVVMEKLLVTGMGHAWSGGDSAGSYTDPMGPNASQLAWEFLSGAAVTDMGASIDASTTASVDSSVTSPSDEGASSNSTSKVNSGCSMTSDAPASFMPLLILAVLSLQRGRWRRSSRAG